jgi:hypothetical protein
VIRNNLGDTKILKKWLERIIRKPSKELSVNTMLRVKTQLLWEEKGKSLDPNLMQQAFFDGKTTFKPPKLPAIF